MDHRLPALRWALRIDETLEPCQDESHIGPSPDKQAIAYETALEAINDVIAGYSEQIALEHGRVVPNTARIAWLEMRTDQASATGHALNVMDDENVRQTLLEYSAIVRARDGAG